MGAGSPDSIRKVAERGYNLLLDQFASPDDVAERIAIFKAEVEKRGRAFDPMEVGVARAFYVAKDAADKEAALERRLEAQRRLDAISSAPDGTEHREHPDALPTPARRARRARCTAPPTRSRRSSSDLREPASDTCCSTAAAGLAGDSLRRFAREVMPHFAGDSKCAVV